MKNQILEHCAQCASHHVALAKLHRSMSEDSTGAAKEFHKSSAAEHTAHGEYFLKMFKRIQSGEDTIDTHSDERGTDSIKIGRREDLIKFGMLGLRDSDKLMPTKVHLALPDMPFSTGNRLIARAGSAPINEAGDDTEKIDAFAHSGTEIRKAILDK